MKINYTYQGRKLMDTKAFLHSSAEDLVLALQKKSNNLENKQLEFAAALLLIHLAKQIENPESYWLELLISKTIEIAGEELKKIKEE